MDHYDEDLFENVFFQSLQKNYPQLFDQATSLRWMIAVPRCNVLENMKFELEDFENHILMPVDDRPTVFHTVNRKETSIKSSAITTGEGFEKKKTVAILFEETFFNKNDESYRVLCVSQPLVGGTDSFVDCNDVTDKSAFGLYSYNDCCELLWGNTRNVKMKMMLKATVDNFLKTLNKPTTEFMLDSLLSTVVLLFTKSIKVVLKDPVLKRNAAANLETRHNISIALETYILHNIYRVLFRRICTCVAADDEKLNKITRGFTGLQLKQLDVRLKFCQNVPRARKELSNLSRLMSPMGKLNCLQRVMTILVYGTAVLSNKDDICDQMDGNNHDVISFCSDDLLPILVFMVIKTEIPNWWAQWTFMKRFHLAKKNLSDELEFYLSTLEASLQHVTTGQLSDLRMSTDISITSFTLTPPASGISQNNQETVARSLAEFFQAVGENKTEIVEKMLLQPAAAAAATMAAAPPSENNVEQADLCHPLCSCPKCRRKTILSNETQVKSYVTVNTCNDLGISVLHVAAMNGHIEMADFLIDKGADVNATDHMGLTPLLIAAQRGYQKLVMLFLHHSKSVNAIDKKKNTALHWSSLNGHVECVKALIYIGENGKDIELNATNDASQTPLHMAATWGYEDIVSILLEHGASPSIRDRKNQNATDVVHNMRIYRMLVEAATQEKAATVTTALKSNNVTRHFSESSSPSVSRHGSTEYTHFQRSVDCSSSSPSSSLIARPVSASVSHQKSIDNSELSRSTDYSSPSAPYSMNSKVFRRLSSTLPQKKPSNFSLQSERKIEKLLKSVADGDIQMVKYHFDWLDYEMDYPELNEIDVTKMNLCHPLCQCDQCRHIQKLTEASASGVHVNSVNSQGYAPLHVAALHGHSDLVRLFLKRGADVNARTKTHSNAPLHFACKQPNVKIVRCLVDYKARITARDDNRNTPLHYCSFSSNASHAWFLLQKGADVNAVNGNGNTPLHDAIKHKNPAIVQTLIHFGASVTARNNQTLTPLHLAQGRGLERCVMLALAQKSQPSPPVRHYDYTDSKTSTSSVVQDSDDLTKLFSKFIPSRMKKFSSLPNIRDASLKESRTRPSASKDDSVLLGSLEAERHVDGIDV